MTQQMKIKKIKENVTKQKYNLQKKGILLLLKITSAHVNRSTDIPYWITDLTLLLTLKVEKSMLNYVCSQRLAVFIEHTKFVLSFTLPKEIKQVPKQYLHLNIPV